MALQNSRPPGPQASPSPTPSLIAPQQGGGPDGTPPATGCAAIPEAQLRTLGIDQPKAVARFWSHVRKTSTCWLWTGARRSGGYGVFRLGARTVSAHRLAWELAYGPIPPRTSEQQARGEVWQVVHRCGNPHCVRPDHLHLLAGRPIGRAARP